MAPGAKKFLSLGLLALALAVGLTAQAAGRSYTPRPGHVFAGLTGGTTIVPFERMVGKHPPVFEVFTTWNTPTKWIAAHNNFRARLGLHISTSPGYGRPGVITPQDIALGRGDKFLVALNGNITRSGRIVYVRLMAEMDAHWNAYAAFDASGAFRGSQNSQHAFIQAWRRTVVILRGGSLAHINRVLRRRHLPRLQVSIRHDGYRRAGQRKGPGLPRPKVAFIWDPQDAGSPDIPGNQPGNYWPGGAYVDWVGTDFYSSYPNFAQLSRFYSSFRGKPFELGEWALYGRDNPGFVRAVFAWARSHGRVRMLNYYQGFNPASPANLARYPRSRAVLRRLLRARRFLGYPPEYSRRKQHKHHGPPETPPQPSKPGAPPNPPSGTPQQPCVLFVQVCFPLP